MSKTRKYLLLLLATSAVFSLITIRELKKEEARQHAVENVLALVDALHELNGCGSHRQKVALIYPDGTPVPPDVAIPKKDEDFPPDVAIPDPPDLADGCIPDISGQLRDAQPFTIPPGADDESYDI